ncbi:MAG: TrkA family potassium uptake protein [Candidatus Izemoplasmatales bacterium]|jgi:trk system potassium uptake protein TrkA|nr:TrkA family potassium uptake protein [Candidatus Izemoplasmatales bacterium]MDD4595328.1 TrkA family potassium uptake protein [Candidatus Izemoplasmatales bacterium]
MQSMLVIGLGRFGRHLALKLAELGNEVMIVDQDEDIVNKLAPFVTSAHIGDCMDEEVVKSLGVRNFDVCFVCISENFQSSLEITSLLKENGAKMVVSKTDREIHAKFLMKIGADAVIHPERDIAWRAAMKYTAKNVFDYIEFTPEYAIFEISVPYIWIGHTIRDLKIREHYSINIVGIKTDTEVTPVVNADHLFSEKEHLFVAGKKEDVMKLMNR